MNDQEYELVDSLYDRFKFATRQYESALEVAERCRISMEQTREDWQLIKNKKESA